jgi:hypothetical protein
MQIEVSHLLRLWHVSCNGRVWSMLARKRYAGHGEAQVKTIWQQVPR